MEIKTERGFSRISYLQDDASLGPRAPSPATRGRRATLQKGLEHFRACENAGEGARGPSKSLETRAGKFLENYASVPPSRKITVPLT